MINNPYMNYYNAQSNVDRINDQIMQLENMKKHLQQPTTQPTNLTQNFQIAPTNRENMKYASSINEVQRETVFNDTPFFSKDMSVVWLKNNRGDIKTYELTEIVPKDEKDLTIEMLQAQIEELKGKIENEQYATNNDDTNDETNTTKDNETIGTTTKTGKPSSVSRISKSKTR